MERAKILIDAAVWERPQRGSAVSSKSWVPTTGEGGWGWDAEPKYRSSV